MVGRRTFDSYPIGKTSNMYYTIVAYATKQHTGHTKSVSME